MAHGTSEAGAGGDTLLCQSAVAKLAAVRAEIRWLVTERLAARGDVAAFEDEDELAEIGIASLDMVALILALERHFDTEIPRSEMTHARFRSVISLAEMMVRLAPSAMPIARGCPSIASGGASAGNAGD